MTLPNHTLGRLRQRPEFLFVAKGAYAARGCVVIQARKNETRTLGVHVGVTVTKKVGNSVVRSRAKRRLREAAKVLLPTLGRDGYDYVFIARASLPKMKYSQLLIDTQKALVKLASERHNTENPIPLDPKRDQHERTT